MVIFMLAALSANPRRLRADDAVLCVPVAVAEVPRRLRADDAVVLCVPVAVVEVPRRLKTELFRLAERGTKPGTKLRGLSLQRHPQIIFSYFSRF